MSKKQEVNAKLLGRKREVQETDVTDSILLQKPVVRREDSIETFMKELKTETTDERSEVMEECLKLLHERKDWVLKKAEHLKYLNMAFSLQLPSNMSVLDASQPWLLYWIANSLSVLDNKTDNLTDDFRTRIVEKLNAISPDGGPYSGGIGQLAHNASNYAAINALALCENINDCWDKIDRDAIHDWLLMLKQSNGGFKTCLEVGEIDIRGVYCALSIASLLNILTPELTDGVLSYIISCQSYEGGFGATPLTEESHGGYTFCGVASLAILNGLDKININKLLQWCSSKQCSEEMGFCGRSNKLVDGCYGFWVGGTCGILEAYGYGTFMNKKALRDYTLACCQSKHLPGLRDKPGKKPDFYHTNYALIGLVCTESEYSITTERKISNESSLHITSEPNKSLPNSHCSTVNPVYGLPISSVTAFSKHFR
ncbi:hypothetical protein TBLA_0B09490 [Henningerozyma blattae CBS 6284]|uniref:Protein farnesyltransferase subunit beta n=1 Tax=Henningerozyma blattae (strain ATCC 34711 / CBS 6284 / DSM 70876 / NBRC 10599 / NRRL Y-10934 / UCD 77-7) TaxID=1071380 RepID=I2H064_HENB6|nr:hypothetical protein TBLA_0B09490 [Tetrapisispora blattae CBS 6284]CCH59766.1 hypothetical protein TBLA_0B09490 [Tetrapisispora blattae CBS 6284]